MIVPAWTNKSYPGSRDCWGVQNQTWKQVPALAMQVKFLSQQGTKSSFSQIRVFLLHLNNNLDGYKKNWWQCVEAHWRPEFPISFHTETASGPWNLSDWLWVVMNWISGADQVTDSNLWWVSEPWRDATTEHLIRETKKRPLRNKAQTEPTRFCTLLQSESW